MNSDLDIYLRLPFREEKFVLDKDFIAYVDVGGVSHEWIIPKGQTTDFASIPGILHWWLSPTDARIAIPALIHDSMYARKVFTRAQADKVLFAKCLSFNLPISKTLAVYLAVRLFGWKRYNQKI